LINIGTSTFTIKGKTIEYCMNNSRGIFTGDLTAEPELN
jgi:hypothetical protein